ncbi:hypothetical protein HMPREF2534_02830 [Bacteroides thetaiotaomicron]|nr:hypothetical protein HMPREF2534_02830 [Bacteroides thetaiotaomicron]
MTQALYSKPIFPDVRNTSLTLQHKTNYQHDHENYNYSHSFYV